MDASDLPRDSAGDITPTPQTNGQAIHQDYSATTATMSPEMTSRAPSAPGVARSSADQSTDAGSLQGQFAALAAAAGVVTSQPTPSQEQQLDQSQSNQSMLSSVSVKTETPLQPQPPLQANVGSASQQFPTASATVNDMDRFPMPPLSTSRSADMIMSNGTLLPKGPVPANLSASSPGEESALNVQWPRQSPATQEVGGTASFPADSSPEAKFPIDPQSIQTAGPAGGVSSHAGTDVPLSSDVVLMNPGQEAQTSGNTHTQAETPATTAGPSGLSSPSIGREPEAGATSQSSNGNSGAFPKGHRGLLGQFPATPPQSTGVSGKQSTAVPVTPKSNNPRVNAYEARIAKDDFDVDAWQGLFQEFLNEYHRNDDDQAMRAVYERFLTRFPTSVKHWLMFLELELRPKNPSSHTMVSAVFGKCLRTVPSVALYHEYIRYIRRVHDFTNADSNPEVPRDKLLKQRATIQKAYEFTLDRVGMDRNAGELWLEYIQFVNSQKCASTYEEQQKMDLVRKTYQKAVALPLSNVEQIWKSWDGFENSLNKLTARKFLADKSAVYTNARAATRQLKSLMDPLDTDTLPRKPSGSKKELDQLSKWRRYIEWEKSDPLKFEDKSWLYLRVVYAYKQCLLVFRHHPPLWFDYSNYIQRVGGKPEQAIEVLRTGCEACPMSYLLHFTLADLEEGRNKSQAARDIYEGLSKRLKEKYESLQSGFGLGDSEEASNISGVGESQKAEGTPRTTGHIALETDDLAEKTRREEREKAKAQREAQKERESKLRPVREAYSLTMIAYMRFCRRTDGVKSARTLFARLRKEAICTWHVWVASALMEYHVTKDTTVAGKIFELGLKTFGMDVEYVLVYLDWLMQLNDDSNLRALFERVLAAIPKEQAKPIWDRYFRFESKWGDLKTLAKLESRWADSYMSVTPERESMLPLALRRYTLFGLTNVATEDLLIPQKAVDSASSYESLVADSMAGISSNKGGPLPGGKKRLLDYVSKHKYPMPDLTGKGWQSFKPSRVTATGHDEHSMSGRGHSMSPSRDVSQTSHGHGPVHAYGHPPHPPSDRGRSPVPAGRLPESIRQLLNALPLPMQYRGPRLHVDELLRAIRNTSLPAPSANGSYPRRTQSGNGMPGVSPLRRKRPANPNGPGGGAPGMGMPRGAGMAGGGGGQRSRKKARRGY